MSIREQLTQMYEGDLENDIPKDDGDLMAQVETFAAEPLNDHDILEEISEETNGQSKNSAYIIIICPAAR